MVSASPDIPVARAAAAGRLRVVFASTMAGAPWGGSEELWHGTAKRMRLAGHEIGVSVYQWPEPPPRVMELAKLGCDIDYRIQRPGLLGRLVQRRFARANGVDVPEATYHWLKRFKPDLVVISQGFPLEATDWMLACRRLGIPYATVVQAAGELWWPEDSMLDALRTAYAEAAGVFFVSSSNRKLVERQLGIRLGNAAVVSNPWNLKAGGAVPWPSQDGMIELACVGRMDPRAKGQDLILDVLSRETWRSRPVRLNFYGGGPCDASVRRLTAMLDVPHVRFHGQVADIRSLWAANHALVLPSRFEGLPLVIVEAMLCGRVVITTDVAGNAEYLHDGVNGFVAPAPAAGLLDLAMERAWAARDRWPAIGAQAREDVLAVLPADPYHAFESALLNALHQGGAS